MAADEEDGGEGGDFRLVGRSMLGWNRDGSLEMEVEESSGSGERRTMEGKRTRQTRLSELWKVNELTI